MSNNYPSFPNSGDDNPYTGGEQSGFGQQPQGGYGQNGYDQGGYGQQQPQGEQYPSFPGANQMAPGALRPGAWKRFLGYFLDAIIVGFFSTIMGLLMGRYLFADEISAWWSSTMESSDATSSSSFPQLPVGLLLASTFSTLILWFAYRMIMEVNAGGTLGKMAISARVKMSDGAPLTYGASFIRNTWFLAWIFTNLIPILGNLAFLAVLIAVGVTIGRDPNKQSFSDKWAKAIVVDK